MLLCEWNIRSLAMMSGLAVIMRLLILAGTYTRELGIKPPPLKVQKFRQICGSTIFHQIWEFFSSSSIFDQIWTKFSGASIFLQNFGHFLLIYTVNPYYFGTFFHQIWSFLGCSYFWPKFSGASIFRQIPEFWEGVIYYRGGFCF